MSKNNNPEFDSIARFAYYLEKHNPNDSGALGDCLELTLRDLIQPTSKRSGKISGTNAYYGDMRYSRHNIKVEIKSACGELAVIDSDSSDVDELVSQILPKANLIFYCPEIFPKIPVGDQTFVFTRDEFLAMINNYPGSGKIIRAKYATNGGYRLSFQSFYSEGRPKASKKIAEYIWDSCYNQPTVADWLMEERA